MLEPPQELLPVQGCWVAVVAGTATDGGGIAGFGVVPGTTAGGCTAAGGTVDAAWGQVFGPWHRSCCWVPMIGPRCGWGGSVGFPGHHRFWRGQGG